MTMNKRKITRFLLYYVLVLAVSISVIFLGTWFYTLRSDKPFQQSLSLPVFIGALFLLAMGAVDAVPILQFSYVRGGRINQPMAREGLREMEKGVTPRDNSFGLALILAGVTLLILWAVMFSQ